VSVWQAISDVIFGGSDSNWQLKLIDFGFEKCWMQTFLFEGLMVCDSVSFSIIFCI
jgi:hypothetical protein